jgi:hypothetical protein
MKTWNVITGVVQLIEAETVEEAILMAAERTQAAVDTFGDVYDLDHAFDTSMYKVAFESEETMA